MTTENDVSVKPECYGDPEKVCPIGERGVIEPNLECLSCAFIKRCLASALQKRGVIATPFKETPVVKKTIGFISRWSKLKRHKS